MLNCKNYFNTHFSKCEEKIQDVVFEKISYEKDSGEIGYYLLHETQQATVDQIESFMKQKRPLVAGEIENVVVIGIGGSWSKSGRFYACA